MYTDEYIFITLPTVPSAVCKGNCLLFCDPFKMQYADGASDEMKPPGELVSGVNNQATRVGPLFPNKTNHTK